jgi:RNA polymerase sigma-70 factor (ECF subfamily)
MAIGSIVAGIEPFQCIAAHTVDEPRALAMPEADRPGSESSRAVQDSAERALLGAIASGDRAALTRLYTDYHPRLFKFVYRLTRSHAVTDELINDIMLAIWRGAGSFRGDSKPSTWILGIAYRQALKRLSRKTVSIAEGLEVDLLPHADTGSFEREDWVRRGLDVLPPAQRFAVELVFYLGLSYEEVAAVTDCPVNTVKTRMFHARRKLRQQLEASASAADSQGEDK